MENLLQYIRKDYTVNILSELSVEKNPFDQFHKWFQEVLENNFKEPTAMIVATSNAAGEPTVRTVLMKDYNKDGIVFFTNYQSKKGKDLEENPRAALLFYWDILERQVRIRGEVQKTSVAVSNQYFASRPKASRIGAIASLQSSVIEKMALEQQVKKLSAQFANTEDVPRPENWGGYIVKPHYFEFWQGRPNRLHDRIIYEWVNNAWKIYRLAP